MFQISALRLTEADVEENELECALVDYAFILAAEIAQAETFEGCNQPATYSIAFKPAEDMVIPIFLCKLHFNALRISLREGVAVDEEILD